MPSRWLPSVLSGVSSGAWARGPNRQRSRSSTRPRSCRLVCTCGVWRPMLQAHSLPHSAFPEWTDVMTHWGSLMLASGASRGCVYCARVPLSRARVLPACDALACRMRAFHAGSDCSVRVADDMRLSYSLVACAGRPCLSRALVALAPRVLLGRSPVACACALVGLACRVWSCVCFFPLHFVSDF